MALPHNRQILIFENSFKLCNYLLKEFLRLAEESIRKTGQFTIALSGGKSPMEFYIKLGSIKEYDIWPKTHLFLVDERFLPEDHIDSNFHMIRESLINDIPIPAENIHKIPTQTAMLKDAQKKYQQELKSFFNLSQGEFPVFDFILLGMGEDGHTASLFPKQKEATELDSLVVSTSAKHIPYDRVSLSLSVLNYGRNLFFITLGEKKAGIVKEIFADKKIYPASLVHPTNGNLTVLLDKSAAQNLNYKDSHTHMGDAISFDVKANHV